MSSAERTAAGSSGTPTSAAKPAAGARPGTRGGGVDAVPRRVRLTLSRIDPWSVTKLSFLLSVAVGIALVVATGVVWSVLNGMGVFTDLDGLFRDIVGSEIQIDLLDYVGFSKVISLATVVAVIDVILLTALSTLVAFLYNVCSALVGGLQVTLSDD
ncbi:DUF3566 domain-containing protein [Kineococcus gynurae]|uniref:DUF3566 domain-containing protein n=1 Tax=Kineococcus gynurae TaxID=452979 RepID=A0ABV5LSY5_9ACTN